eukprot:gene8648-595_t
MSKDIKKESVKKFKKLLKKHEIDLLEKGELTNITHKGSSSVWLESEATKELKDDETLVYRPLGDNELMFLLQNNQLPDTQPYQTIVEGEAGLIYSEKYLNGKKKTDTYPSTIIEFKTKKELIEVLKKKQIKIEDGCLSMGLGFTAGKGLPLFNESMEIGETTFRIVKVKRKLEK